MYDWSEIYKSKTVNATGENAPCRLEVLHLPQQELFTTSRAFRATSVSQ